MTTTSTSKRQALDEHVIRQLKGRFTGRDEVVDLIALAAVAREHLFIHGPPGTAKSALIREFAAAVQGRYFEYMLTRFSEPNEIFGPIDIAKLREGSVVTVTAGMLPEAEFVFLDELFNANSAILNNLLTVLNERVYRRGAEKHELPLVSLFSASNHLPEDDALQALFDRFLLRCHVGMLPRSVMPDLLTRGWERENSEVRKAPVSTADLRLLSAEIPRIDLGPVMASYIETACRLRDLGVALSDRRLIKLLKLVAASAILCGRQRAQVSDFWVLRYVWDREEQIEPVVAVVNAVLEAHKEEQNKHEMAAGPEHVDAEDLARQLETMETQTVAGGLGLTTLARLKDQLASLADQTTWLADAAQRTLLLSRIRALLDRLG